MAQKLTTTPNDGDYQDVITSEAEVGTTTTEDMFDGAQTVYGMMLNNSSNAQVVYYRLYNLLDVTPASDVPDIKIRVAASTLTTIFVADGISFSTGMSLRCTSASDDSDTTDPTAVGPAYFVGS